MSSYAEGRRRWAAEMISRAEGRLPSYRSAEWCALPEGDPTKVAAVVVAAECWAREGDELEENLRAEVEALRRAHKQAEDAAYVAGIEAHRERWRHLRVAPARADPEPPRDLYEIGAEYMAARRTGGAR